MTSSSHLLLSQDEITDVTGYRKPALQVRELHSRGFVRARVNVLNRVVLERAHFEAVCSSAAGNSAQAANQPQLLTPASLLRKARR
jgi:hypothetical protein